MTVPLDGIDLVIFDKDGTLIEFHAMWGGWARKLAADLRLATGRPIEEPLFEMLGYDAATGSVLPHGGLAATPMSRLADRTRDVLLSAGLSPTAADGALATAWHAPDPVALASPLADLGALFARLHSDGRAVAVATSDDRDPTVRTVVVGDSPADLQMGRGARVGLTIGVLTGVGDRVDLDPLADLVIDSVARLLEP